jgi:uncharacterized protein (TIGR02996 family)
MPETPPNKPSSSTIEETAANVMSVPMTSEDSLDRAFRAVSKGAFSESVEQLRRAWRSVPATRIADVLDAVAARGSEGLSPPTGRTAKERDAAWHTACVERDPIVYGLLVESLLDTRSNKQTLERFEALVDHGPDPRLGAWLAAVFRDPPYYVGASRTGKFWRRMFGAIPEIGDPRLAELAETLPDHWKNTDANVDELNALLDRVIDTIRQMPAPPLLSAAAEKACDEILDALGPRPASAVHEARTEEELLSAVYADPRADAPRLVYQDWLLEGGDPRGEFIALQFAAARGKLTAAERKREKELLAEFGRHWVGDLDEHLLAAGRVFERGFLSECRAKSVTLSWAWSTVRRLSGAVPPSDDHHLLSLELLSDVGSYDTKRLANLKRPLGITELRTKEHPPRDEWQRISALPSLRRLWFINEWMDDSTPDAFGWLWDSPAMGSVTELVLSLFTRNREGSAHALLECLETWWRAMPARRLSELTLSTGAGNCWDQGFQVTFTRDEDRASLRIAAPPSRKVLASTRTAVVEDLVSALAAMPEGTFDEATIDKQLERQLEPELLERLRAAAGAHATLAKVGYLKP